MNRSFITGVGVGATKRLGAETISAMLKQELVGEPHGQKANIKKSRGSVGYRRFDD